MSCAGCDDCTLVQIGTKVSPFEIHMTVDPSTNCALFMRVCQENDIKPLFINNYASVGSPPILDMMTRSIVKGDIKEVGDEMFRVFMTLKNHDIKVVRSKVETVPWLYDRLKDFSSEANVPYFETHIEVEMKFGLTFSDIVRVAKRYGGYVSQNVYKTNVVMITVRLDNIDDANYKIYSDRIRGNLEEAGLKLGRNIIELTFHDDNKGHDDAWLSAL